MEQLVMVLLFIVFLQNRIMDLRKAVLCLCAQSAVIAGACLIMGLAGGHGVQGLLPVLMTILVNVCLIPYALFRLIGKLTDPKEIVSGINTNYSTGLSAVFLMLSYLIVDKMLPGVGNRDIMASSMGLILIGLVLIVMRSRAIMQIVGLMTMENGIYLLGLAMTEGLRLVIVQGVVLDGLVAVLVLVILANRLNVSFMTTDTNVLRRLKG
jgi:hydrogenase-4 component E